jgi:chemotaxis signal transduction protein
MAGRFAAGGAGGRGTRMSLTGLDLWTSFWRGSMKLLMVSVGQGRYAVSADAVARILDPELEPELRRAVQEGQAAVEGQPVRIVDLHRLAGETRTGTGVFLLVRLGSARTLLPVDQAEAIREVAPSAIAPLPPFIFAGEKRLFRGVFDDGERARLLLDEEALR